LHQFSRPGQKDCHHRWERRRLCAVAKFETAADKTNFMRLAVYPIVEPSGVGARMSEENDERSPLCGLVALPRPLAHRLAVRRIAKHSMLFPILFEPVVFFCEEGRAFFIGG